MVKLQSLEIIPRPSDDASNRRHARLHRLEIVRERLRATDEGLSARFGANDDGGARRMRPRRIRRRADAPAGQPNRRAVRAKHRAARDGRRGHRG